MATEFHDKIHVALSDLTLQGNIRNAVGQFTRKRRTAVETLPADEYEELRNHAREIKNHTLDNLDYYLEQLESQVRARGGEVIWCPDGEAACEAVQSIARSHGVRLAVKSKSMATEEVRLNEALEEAGVEPIETDLGEFIQQLAGERPFHIVAPAMHKSRGEVGRLFASKLGSEPTDDPSRLTMTARKVLRDKFLQAGMGITGANFLIAESGAVVLVENEGNIRLSTSLPRIHVALAGIEKVIPRAADLAVFLKLLARNGSGQALTSYTSFLSGGRREGERNGPEQFYLLLLDNGRTRVLADAEKRETLRCIRCGACANVCPVYARIGGHSYPGTYSGPIGAILTPQFQGPSHEPELPYASSLCGACAEVCPVKIDIPRMLLALRRDVKEMDFDDRKSRLEKFGFRVWSWVMRHPWAYEAAGFAGQAVVSRPEQGRWLRSAPGLRGWTETRDFPPLAQRSFRRLWRERRNRAKRWRRISAGWRKVIRPD